jgi:putative OPT family oligopeptide transporter
MTPSDGKELTWRGVALGSGLTLVFTAANIYLGLKVGLTFATSIPAAVISMALLGFFSGSNIRENNIVQTVCSAAGAMASIIFVLPGLVIVGWWAGFPFWTSFWICAAGGVLGVLFTIPLRRALVTNSDLPYPEGVAGAEVLKVGADTRSGNPEAREGLIAVIYGSLASAGLALTTAMRLTADSISSFFRLGAGATGYTFSFSLALMGAGHLVGISVGVAMVLGILIAWGGAVPIFTAMTPMHGDLSSFVMGIWSGKVRFIGAGAMAVAAVWSLLRTLGPILSGLAETVRVRSVLAPGDHTDRDIPLKLVGALALAATAITTWLVWRFSADASLGGQAIAIAGISIPLILIGGFLVAAVCGYMAGLIGSSNSPISGIGILAVMGTAVALAALFGAEGGNASALVAIALFITSILFAVACSSNDNLQDLKTGQLVAAAPWRQQVALLVGVAASSVTVPLVLNLLAKAYGFAGAANLHTVTAQPLAAPQANLISILAKSVVGGTLNWNLIGIGVLIGLGIVAVDEFMRMRGWLRIPPLAVGFGIYLPIELTLTVALGAFIGWFYNRRARDERAKRLGVLVASGMIVGESLFGVINAGVIVGFNRDAPLAVVPAGFSLAHTLGPLGFLLLVILLYGWLVRRTPGKAA